MKNRAAVELGRRGGLKGGRARAERLSDEQRSAIAALGGRAKWERERKRREGRETVTGCVKRMVREIYATGGKQHSLFIDVAGDAKFCTLDGPMFDILQKSAREKWVGNFGPDDTVTGIITEVMEGGFTGNIT